MHAAMIDGALCLVASDLDDASALQRWIDAGCLFDVDMGGYGETLEQLNAASGVMQ